MVFSSTVFLFIFLPIVLTIHFLLARNYRNLFLLIASLFFYAWGEHILVLLMMASICINYIFGIVVWYLGKSERQRWSKLVLTIGVLLNLLMLGYYKYIHFLLDTLSQVGIKLDVDVSSVVLPIGISFFVFQGISYLIDVYRKIIEGEKSLINLGMYISLFPQLTAGPIVRYEDIIKEIRSREILFPLFKEGVFRFIGGFAKKILIANNVGLIADEIFAIQPNDLSTTLTWIGIVCYTLQIYYDFSGYSDMAIGLGKMLGFNFKENFDYPYISKSIREFWRRWHISLSSWFRDYLYIPLGGNQKGKYRTYVNFLIVFFLTGLWHGASWNFVIWGLFHGFFIIIERLNIIKVPTRFYVIGNIYTLLIVMIGWVLFRSENLEYAVGFILKMFSFTPGNNNYPYIFLNKYTFTVLFIGSVLALPLREFIKKKANFVITNQNIRNILKQSFFVVLFILCLMELAQTTYNPFIYFRF